MPSSVSTLGDSSESDEVDSQYSMSTMDTEASSTPSVFPFDVNNKNELYRELHGRLFNNRSTLYNLPADEIEFSRLDKQHLMHQLALGSLYQEPETVQRILAPVPGQTKAILDCGTGGGNWAIGMAEEFPHAQVVGVDLAPNTSRVPPSNCRFEFDDVMLGMPHYYGCFDVVHARSCATGISDFPAFIAEMSRCLKPGGILLVAEGDLQLYSEMFLPMETMSETGSSMCRMLFETYNVLKGRGSQVDAGRFLFQWLDANDNLENPAKLDLYTPIGPWRRGRTEDETARLMFIGELMRQNSVEFTRGLKPILVEEGYSEEILDRWIRGTDEELASLSFHMHTHWYYACAIKKHDEISAVI